MQERVTIIIIIMMIILMKLLNLVICFQVVLHFLASVLYIVLFVVESK